MALGSVSISTFIPGELENLTGTVSIIPFTRAEIERLANKKAYPNGKVVWSQGISASGSIAVPEEVDYITAGYGDQTYTVARGYSQSWVRTGVIINQSYTVTYTLRFNKDGTFRTSWSSTNSSVEVSGSYTLTGYHYY